MKKILILGSAGTLGHVTERYLKETGKYTVVGKNREHFDARNLSITTAVILEVKPDCIINCVGILNNQSKSAQLYADVNIVFPKYLASIAKIYNFKLITISTNCVFSNRGPHTANEEIISEGLNLYGMSKAFGEINDNHNLTIRTSFIGPELKKDGVNLFNWFVNKSEKKVDGFTTALWNGVTSLQLAKFIDEMVESDKTGIINYYSKKEISKYALLWAINETYNLKKEINAVSKEGVHSSLLIGPYYTEKDIPTQIRELKGWYDEKT